jgi:hypothetical protein
VRLLSRLHHTEHLLFTDTLHFRQRHTKPRRLLVSLLLNRTRQCLRVRLITPVQQILGQRFGRRLGGLAVLDVPLLVSADLLLHLDLFLSALLGVHLSAQAPEVLRLVRGIVAFTGDALAFSFVVVEAMEALELLG